ncbi:MAG TPA: hypothetical protein VNC41_10365, partial [Acidimicrobiia bacterium]|nr:hypothetical protein [Acidimicrobiia bacterium]
PGVGVTFSWLTAEAIPIAVACKPSASTAASAIAPRRKLLEFIPALPDIPRSNTGATAPPEES